MNRKPYLWRQLPDGRRQVSWRVWVLIWVTPVVFAAGAAVMAVEAYVRTTHTVPTEGEVVRVYSWPGESPWNRGVMEYAPIFRYVWTDGTETEASGGYRDPDWNFEIGSRHAIRYWPDRKTDVVLEGRHNWFVAKVIAVMAVILVFPALAIHLAVQRWRNRGAQPR